MLMSFYLIYNAIQLKEALISFKRTANRCEIVVTGRNVEARKTNYVAVVGENSEPSVSVQCPVQCSFPNVSKCLMPCCEKRKHHSTGNHPLSIN